MKATLVRTGRVEASHSLEYAGGEGLTHGHTFHIAVAVKGIVKAIVTEKLFAGYEKRPVFHQTFSSLQYKSGYFVNVNDVDRPIYKDPIQDADVGMVMSPEALDDIIITATENLDRDHLNDYIANPTPERLAEYIALKVRGELPLGVELAYVKVGEGDLDDFVIVLGEDLDVEVEACCKMQDGLSY